MKYFLIFLFIKTCFAQPLDILGEGRKLLKSKDFSSLQSLLGTADMSFFNKVERDEINLLKAQVSVYFKRFDLARTQLDQVVQQNNDQHAFTSSQALLGLGQYQRALAKFQMVSPSFVSSEPNAYLVASLIFHRLNQLEKAWAAIIKGPANLPYLKQKLSLMVELKLYSQASKLALQITQKYPDDLNSLYYLLTTLIENDLNDSALKLLLSAELQGVQSEKIYLAMAKLFFQKEMRLNAAWALERAGMYKNSYLAEASELYLQLGKPEKAKYLNAQIKDRKLKIKRSIAHLVEKSQFPLIVAQEESLILNNLLTDDQIRYALAYSFFRVGQLKKADVHLNGIKNDAVVKKIIALKTAIKECKEEASKCH